LLRGTLVADDPDAAEAEAAAKVEAEAMVRTDADAILKAAELRDSGGPPLPKPTGLAGKIVAAAAKAHRKAGE
jgi:hypothetical protein